MTIEFTAQTAVASTVHHPFGSPSGPGLWHVKGMQLPAYIQNVAHALVRSGKDESRAIGMAVGIVKNWAHGHDGHGNAVSAEVQAAAAKAIAEWEASKVRAHADNSSVHNADAVIDLDWSKWDAAHKGQAQAQTWQQKGEATYKAGLASVHSKQITPQMIVAARNALAAQKAKAAAAKKSATAKKAAAKKAAKAKKAPVKNVHKVAKPVHLSIELAMPHVHKQNMTKEELGSHLQNQHSLRVDNGTTRARMASLHSQCHTGPKA